MRFPCDSHSFLCIPMHSYAIPIRFLCKFSIDFQPSFAQKQAVFRGISNSRARREKNSPPASNVLAKEALGEMRPTHYLRWIAHASRPATGRGMAILAVFLHGLEALAPERAIMTLLVANANKCPNTPNPTRKHVHPFPRRTGQPLPRPAPVRALQGPGRRLLAWFTAEQGVLVCGRRAWARR